MGTSTRTEIQTETIPTTSSNPGKKPVKSNLRCHRPIRRMPLRTGVTGTSSSESYDDDYPLDLGELDTDGSVFSPREEPGVLESDLV
jgi:hypothetical protein